MGLNRGAAPRKGRAAFCCLDHQLRALTSYAIPRASPNSPTAKTTPVGGLILRPCHQLRQLGDVGRNAPGLIACDGSEMIAGDAGCPFIGLRRRFRFCESSLPLRAMRLDKCRHRKDGIGYFKSAVGWAVESVRQAGSRK